LRVSSIGARGQAWERGHLARRACADLGVVNSGRDARAPRRNTAVPDSGTMPIHSSCK
jgi:hypothetical protein